jgi:hypothetical protein
VLGLGIGRGVFDIYSIDILARIDLFELTEIFHVCIDDYDTRNTYAGSRNLALLGQNKHLVKWRLSSQSTYQSLREGATSFDVVFLDKEEFMPELAGLENMVSPFNLWNVYIALIES